MKNNKNINFRKISPDYPRIPHLNNEVSKMTFDDIELGYKIKFPFNCYVQEKVDGSNMGISWIDGPIIRNRSNILKKGYIKKNTPAKRQFRPAWNWLHEHSKDIERISDECLSHITVYGEWMNFKHSIFYDKLPDIFLAYDIWSVEYSKFLDVDTFESLLDKTNIRYIKSNKVNFNSIEDVVSYSEGNSEYREGKKEGIVIRNNDSKFKVVNRFFERIDNFNIIEPIKNIII